jgi:hypothetical protein
LRDRGWRREFDLDRLATLAEPTLVEYRSFAEVAAKK